jgi:hypothetical protein
MISGVARRLASSIPGANRLHSKPAAARWSRSGKGATFGACVGHLGFCWWRWAAIRSLDRRRCRTTYRALNRAWAAPRRVPRTGLA